MDHSPDTPAAPEPSPPAMEPRGVDDLIDGLTALHGEAVGLDWDDDLQVDIWLDGWLDHLFDLALLCGEHQMEVLGGLPRDVLEHVALDQIDSAADASYRLFELEKESGDA